MRWIPIIGLEVHVQLKTATKMFCGCPLVEDGAAPNTAICPVCTAQPGALPALNQHAVELGVKTGLALGCRIPDQSAFDRKNYFYPDLPKGYQISQYYAPACLDGRLVVDVPKGLPGRERLEIAIERAHLEEDAAKNVHVPAEAGQEPATYVDFNRAGSPLLEIVSGPDLRSPQEAKAYLQALRGVLRAVGASDADMERGQMRCDANVSLLEVDDEGRPTKAGLNPRTEIKNLNSFRAVERAITFEMERQGKLYAAGQVPEAATRGWDENRGETFDQRSKETSADYRYFPEPDLPPQALQAVRDLFSTRMPELPRETEDRLISEYGLTRPDAAFVVSHDGWVDFTEHVMGELGGWLESDPGDASAGDQMEAKRLELGRFAGGWLTSKFAGLLADRGIDIAAAGIDPEDFAEFLHLVWEGKINSSNAQKLLALMLETKDDPSHLMERHDLGQNLDPEKLAATVRDIIANSPKQVEEVKSGKLGILKWFVGAVMKATDGKANPQEAEEMVKKELGV